jgi:SanA protein
MAALRRFAFRSFAVAALLCVGVASGAWVAQARVEAAARERAFDDLALVPRAPVALVLGCAPRTREGRPNLYFERRMDAAAELFKAQVVEALIASGDNQRADYDEPSAMKAALVARGVPPERIHCDYAGFRTLDSVVRAAEVFGQRRFVIVSQRFHNERALYLARAHGLDAYAYDAAPVGRGGLARARECAARAAALLDVHVLGATPKFLGPAIDVSAPAIDAQPWSNESTADVDALAPARR